MEITICECGNGTFVTLQEPWTNGYGSSIKYYTRCTKCGKLIHAGYDATNVNGIDMMSDN